MKGEPAKNVTYQARIQADASEAELIELMKHTDNVSEIQNTLRIETPVTVKHIEVIAS